VRRSVGRTIPVARTWSELQEQLYADSWDPAIGRFRSPYVFRGVASRSNGLSTSLSRLAAGRDAPTLELSLLRNFRKYAYEHLAHHQDTIWHWLALGQHHGLPTRLTDWTSSPLVALHFATRDMLQAEDDGVIWCVDFVRANTLLPSRLRAILEREHSQSFTVEMLSEFATLSAFDALARRPFVAFLEPPTMDVRILNQFALFSLMPGPSGRLDAWVRAHPTLTRAVTIAARLKWEIRDKLDQANVTERTLFPGLDGLSLWLTRYYAERHGCASGRTLALTKRRRDDTHANGSPGPAVTVPGEGLP
jgi:hypothetical protein